MKTKKYYIAPLTEVIVLNDFMAGPGENASEGIEHGGARNVDFGKSTGIHSGNYIDDPFYRHNPWEQ